MCVITVDGASAIELPLLSRNTDSGAEFYCVVPADFPPPAVGLAHEISVLSGGRRLGGATLTLLGGASWASATLTGDGDICAPNASVAVQGRFNASAEYVCEFQLRDGASRHAASVLANATLLDNSTLSVRLPDFKTSGMTGVVGDLHIHADHDGSFQAMCS